MIALASLAMPGDRERCLEAGMSEYLLKPISKKHLLELLSQYLGNPTAEERSKYEHIES